MIRKLRLEISQRRTILKTKYFIYTKYNGIKSVLTRTARHHPVFNVNQADERSHGKRALLIYLTRPFLVEATDPQLLSHQNFRQCKQIAALLGELGYVVDAVDIRDREFLPWRNYDLIISNKVHLRGMEVFFSDSAVKIYLASTTNHRVHNRSLRDRHERLSRRRGCDVQMRRAYFEVMPYVMSSHAVAGFGNDVIIDTWRESFQGPVYSLNNYGFKETLFVLDGKNFAVARNHFLFFASGSQIQKGLDLLLEIFPKLPHLHLYICSEFQKETDFCACYHKELYQTPNIHALGWVPVNSPEFYQLVRTCAYVIHPSCSDAHPGSVVQCMHAGLILLVTKQTGIDTEDFGMTFPEDSLDEIERVVREVSQLPADWHREHSIKTRKIAEEKYSEDAFLKRWRSILSEVLRSAQVG